MKQIIIAREVIIKKPGTKTGKLYLKLGMPEIEFKKIGELKNEKKKN